MRLLIVEANSPFTRLIADLLHRRDGHAQQLEAMTLVSDLQTALLWLSEHDVVLCDAAFALSPNSRFVVEDWDVVHREASRQGVHFVLYSASVRALNLAHDSDIVAVAKPAAIGEIYAALMSFPLPVMNRGYPGPDNMTEGMRQYGKALGSNHRRPSPEIGDPNS
jgi:hypothetical protein